MNLQRICYLEYDTRKIKCDSICIISFDLNMALTGRICLVTGASKGVGRGIAVQLGEAGATVYITGRSVDKLKECAAEIQKRGGKVSNVTLNLLIHIKNCL